MAELNKKLFGNLKGKFGDAVFRQRKGKNIIAQRPKKFNIRDKEGFENRTGKFRLSSKIASAVMSVPILKSVWKANYAGALSPFQNLIGVNYPFVDGNNVTGPLEIVPEGGIGVKLDSLALTENNLSIALHPLTSDSTIDLSVESKIQAVALVFLNNPVSAGYKKYSLLALSSSRIAFDLTTPVNFNLAVSTADSELISMYQNKQIFSTVITFDAGGQPVKFARTFAYAVQ